jgi:hypothetical protein
MFLSLTNSISSLSAYKVFVSPDHNHWHTHTHTHTLGSTPRDMGSANRRIRYLNRNNNVKPSIPRAGLEPAIPEDKRSYIYFNLRYLRQMSFKDKHSSFVILALAQSKHHKHLRDKISRQVRHTAHSTTEPYLRENKPSQTGRNSKHALDYKMKL